MCSTKQKYSPWFEFAERCLNKNNQSADFEKYRKDEVFLEMMRRLQADKATPDDFQIIELYEQIANTEVELQEEKKRTEQEKKRAEVELQEEKKRAEQEKKRAEQEKKRAEQEKQKRLIAAKTMKDDGMPIALIARYLGLTIDVIEAL